MCIIITRTPSKRARVNNTGIMTVENVSSFVIFFLAHNHKRTVRLFNDNLILGKRECTQEILWDRVDRAISRHIDRLHSKSYDADRSTAKIVSVSSNPPHAAEKTEKTENRIRLAGYCQKSLLLYPSSIIIIFLCTYTGRTVTASLHRGSVEYIRVRAQRRRWRTAVHRVYSFPVPVTGVSVRTGQYNL